MSPQNVQNAIQLLEAIDPADEFAYEKAILAFLTIRQLPICLTVSPKGIDVTRARTHDNDDFFASKGEISLAPVSYVKSFARCNRPFQSRFYCALDIATSYMELVNYWAEKSNPGDKLFVTSGLWAIRQSVTSLIISTPDPAKRLSAYDHECGQILDAFLANYSGDFLEANKILYEYLFDKFRKPANHDPKTYIITTAYCNLALTQSELKQQKVHAIYYPSVPFMGQGVNLCLSPDFIVSGNIELIHAIRCEMTVEIGNAGKYNFKETGAVECKVVDPTSGTIQW